MFNRRLGMAAVALALTAAGCQEPQAPPAEPAKAAPPTVAATASAPEPDMAAAQARIGPDNTLQALTFAPTGSTKVEGEVAGYASPVYAVALAAGQTLAVVFESPSDNLYFNVVDAADGSGAAVFRGEMEGRTASLKSDAGATYLIMPFQPRATARRGETASYTIKVDRR